MSLLLVNMIVLAVVAVFAAAVLYYTARKFHSENNPLVEEIATLLPQANCGACGCAGCADFATKVATASGDSFKSMLCPVGGSKVMAAIAAKLGLEAEDHGRTCAVLRCQGSCQSAPDKATYEGLESCRVATRAFVGASGCPNGCLRLGDCVAACPFGAISISPTTGLPKIDSTRCTSCGTCVRICPRSLYEIRPVSDGGVQVFVACRNTQKGATARKNCKAACIGCLKCTKVCSSAKVVNNLSYIDSGVNPDEWGEALVASCPTKAIVLAKVADDATKEGSAL